METEAKEQTKTRNKSVGVALKAMRNHIATIIDNNLLTDKEAQTIREIHTKAANKYIQDEFKL